MNRLHVVAVASLLLALTASAPVPGASEPRKVFRQVTLAEGVAGRVDTRIAYEKPVKVPLLDCPEGELTCMGDVTFSHVFGIDFGIDSIPATGDFEEDRARPIGRILMALDLDREEEREHERLLGEAIAKISARTLESFEITVSTLESYEIFVVSKAPSRVCEIGPDRTACFVLMLQEEEYLKLVETPDANHTIEQLDALLASRPRDSMQTDIAAIVEERDELFFRYEDAIGGVTWGDELFTIPGTIIDADGKNLFEPSALDLYDAPMWIAEWTVVSTRLEHGARPRETEIGTETLLTALVPSRIVTPNRGAPVGSLDVGTHQEIVVEAEQVVSDVQRGLDSLGRLDLDLAVRPRPKGMFLTVSCRHDGSADYRLHPIPRVGVITNADTVCHVLRGMLD